MNLQRIIELRVEAPFLPLGSRYLLSDRSGEVFWYDGDKLSEYPLRPGLAGYIWLLATEPEYVEIIHKVYEENE